MFEGGWVQAAHPSQDINTIRIRYDHNDSVGRIGKELGCIDIVRRDAATHITVKDVLRGISEHFMKPLTTEELVKAEEYGEASLTRAMKDFRAYSRPGQIAPNDCMRRIDALGYLSRFGGLSVIEVKDGVLELSLNLLSCLDRRGA
ncbi:hypothetical protein DXG01_017139 [Tephrocybe rancida]|nr:hypothetical protein DXG01_017139 [Tephrocybe rancida]